MKTLSANASRLVPTEKNLAQLAKLILVKGQYSPETVFGVATWGFAHQFLTGCNEEYWRVAEALKDSSELVGVLRNLRTKLVKNTYHEQRVWDAYLQYYPFSKKLFVFLTASLTPNFLTKISRLTWKS